MESKHFASATRETGPPRGGSRTSWKWAATVG